jgi:2'-5' RNA ligase
MKRIISVWIRPENRLRKEIVNLTRKFADKYNSYKALNDYKGPHITLFEIAEDPKKLDNVIRRLQPTCWRFRPFEIKINGIGYFRRKDATGKRNYVIYLKVLKNKKLYRLRKEIEKQSFIDAQYPLKFRPHITISRADLDKDRFYAALREYENLIFLKKFAVTGIMVSTRIMTKKKIIKNIHFERNRA